jgi:hypothetical protein
MKTAALLLLIASGLAFAEPRVIYSKSFPGSNPAYVQIEVSKDGSALYKETATDDNAVRFRLDPADAAAIFALADKMDHFKRPLESGLKVAFMGAKTFRFEDGNVKQEAKFNYSQDEDAKVLLDWFEKMTETQMLYFELERAVRFDKLGVNRAVLQIESAVDRKRFIGPERFLPLLDRIAKNEAFMHMARERAATLADSFRNPKPKTEQTKSEQ